MKETTAQIVRRIIERRKAKLFKELEATERNRWGYELRVAGLRAALVELDELEAELKAAIKSSPSSASPSPARRDESR